MKLNLDLHHNLPHLNSSEFSLTVLREEFRITKNLLQPANLPLKSTSLITDHRRVNHMWTVDHLCWRMELQRLKQVNANWISSALNSRSCRKLQNLFCVVMVASFPRRLMALLPRLPSEATGLVWS